MRREWAGENRKWSRGGRRHPRRRQGEDLQQRTVGAPASFLLLRRRPRDHPPDSTLGLAGETLIPLATDGLVVAGAAVVVSEGPPHLPLCALLRAVRLGGPGPGGPSPVVAAATLRGAPPRPVGPPAATVARVVVGGPAARPAWTAGARAPALDAPAEAVRLRPPGAGRRQPPARGSAETEPTWRRGRTAPPRPAAGSLPVLEPGVTVLSVPRLALLLRRPLRREVAAPVVGTASPLGPPPASAWPGPARRRRATEGGPSMGPASQMEGTEHEQGSGSIRPSPTTSK